MFDELGLWLGELMRAFISSLLDDFT
jgi:hypothetical protein